MMKASPDDDVVPVYSVFEPLTIVAYCGTHTHAVRDTQTLLSMARNQELVDHDFAGQKWKVYVTEEIEEEIMKKGEIIYKRMVKRYMEIHCPSADGLVCRMVEMYVEKKLVEISLRYKDECGGYTPIKSLEEKPGDTKECIKKERKVHHTLVRKRVKK